MKPIFRRLLSVMALAAAAVTVVACSSGAGSGASGGSGAGSSASGTTLTIGWAEPPDTLNPATTGARDVGPIDVNVFHTLIYLTKTNQPTPDLPTQWPVGRNGKV